ncbi:hypothetical protein IFVP182_P30023 [Vibrio parahaemolyticus]
MVNFDSYILMIDNHPIKFNTNAIQIQLFNAFKLSLCIDNH